MTPTPQRPVNLLVMCFLSLAIGTIGGLGAWLFRLLIGVLHNLFFLGEWSLSYDANAHTAANPWGAGIILVPVIGAMIVAWLVKTFAPEAKGHGVPEVIDAIHYKRGIIRPIVAVIKSLASAICIGSGGSVGREGPIIQIGSAFGATLGEIINVPARQQVTLVAAGAAAGIAATFNAPLGGVVFAIELLLISINVRTLLPVALATITATYIGRALLGVYPAFNIEPLQVNQFELNSPWMLLLLIPFGVVMGLASVAFIKGIYWTEDQFEKMPGGDLVRHASGMLIAGILFYVMWRSTGRYYLEGIGYASIMDVLTRELTNPAFLLLLCVLKLFVTFLTLGSGGSGGVFSPALFMGATLGSAFAHFANQTLPGVEIDPVTFALAGMAAGVGASTGAMITAAVMLQEMTDDNNVMMPIIVTTIVACTVRKLLCPASIYTLKLLRRGRIVPEGLQAALDDARHVEDVMEKNYRVVAEHAPLDHYSGVTIQAQEGQVVRVFHPFGAGEVNSPTTSDNPETFVQLGPKTPLVEAMREMQQADASCAVVFSQADSDRVDDIAGVITWRELGVYLTRWSELL
ncbi:chloride channel protein [Blastopirellula sp. J2-11]|uniref:chloride channel protein n=1 Tax=Blastopirellula sp. J2-11 TaxID=2943192 RepID=UPI0021C8E6A2|nr:chloride channel protein [Blastopirellula sp. J2-11]UUO04314.1 chloride channel protein [Blastopirellula sp. J2-11]